MHAYLQFTKAAQLLRNIPDNYGHKFQFEYGQHAKAKCRYVWKRKRLGHLSRAFHLRRRNRITRSDQDP